MPPKATKAAAAKAAAKPAAKAAKVTDAKPTAKPTAKSAAKPAAKPAAKSAAKPLANGATKKRKAEDDIEPEDEANDDRKKTKSRAVAKPSSRAPKKAKVDADVETSDADAKPAPKPKVEAKETKPKKAAPPPAVQKPTYPAIGKKINDAPTKALDIYVFGEGTSGELGLGSKIVNGKKPIDVKRPRLNENLSASKVGVVQISCGGMHVVALTRDNKILTWGVNDQGALGRDANWDGGLRDMDKEEDSDDDDDDDTGINPHESTPTALNPDHFAPGTKFVQVIALDSASFVLTEDGRVYGWGTFRSSDGILGFTENIKVQNTPMLLPGLKNIKALAAGANHVLALDHKGNVLAWGCGQQNQLGRRIIERNKLSSLTPQGMGLPRGKIVQVACGSYHSFAIDKDGSVWGWGLNNFGELGVEANAGEDDAVILKPVKVTALEDYTIKSIDGGGHHSLACSDKGELLVWGRVDGYQVGFEPESLNKENTIYDERGDARILFKPTVHETVPKVTSVAAGFDNSFAVTGEGKVYSWGFSSNYQTGQGTIEDIHTPTLIDNTAIRGKMIIGAGAGGQYSMLAGKPDAPTTNGVNGTH
ncbi:regulator of chromosome condensation 1/beta-lactamase-inhibitor protein II [Stachybotrys elegans]|uniref:Regulator of chromosome condensation 1/beta-lactamase-inhibitor protein II n=1 Tax=Stachybotrys elegans TaxID=80388 RepID=A0A8K0SNN3_9HYPO|nr:regulator of chromosome condensation 1/beta-lactamase-inhibitor protein II [Stachybotrys elegans]